MGVSAKISLWEYDQVMHLRLDHYRTCFSNSRDYNRIQLIYGCYLPGIRALSSQTFSNNSILPGLLEVKTQSEWKRRQNIFHAFKPIPRSCDSSLPALGVFVTFKFFWKCSPLLSLLSVPVLSLVPYDGLWNEQVCNNSEWGRKGGIPVNDRDQSMQAVMII